MMMHSRCLMMLRMRQSSRRAFSGGYSSRQYPLATKPPKVTQTSASEAEEKSQKSTFRKLSVKEQQRDPTDKFNDSNSLSDSEIASYKDELNNSLNTSVASTPILGKAPSLIPPNIVSGINVPQTMISTLSNGVRVVSQETYGQVTSIGILGDFGSRHEAHLGEAHLLELMAFSSATPSWRGGSVEIQQQLQDWGATSFANCGREQSLWCLDILRPNVAKGMDLLKQIVLQPEFQEEEIEHSKQVMEFQAMDLPDELKLGEALQTAAYGADQQLGKPHIAPLNSIASLNGDKIRSFLEKQLWNNPKGMVICGAGIGHDELVDMSKEHFGHLQQKTLGAEQTIPSIYRGGECKIISAPDAPTEVDTRIGLALELGGWHSNDLVPTCVLQTLLGGGSSFSAGGPGKGMYSRLYRQVLNRYHWAESAEAFTVFHGESGLVGISGSSKAPNKSRDLIRVLAEHLLKLAHDEVSDEELDRARNMLKNNVLSQLESRLVLFEDMGRQVLTYGHREDNASMTRKIDAVSASDLKELMQRALQKPPTLAIVSTPDDATTTEGTLAYEEVKSWFIS